VKIRTVQFHFVDKNIAVIVQLIGYNNYMRLLPLQAQMTLKNCNNLTSWKLIYFFQLIVLGYHQVFHVQCDSGGEKSILGGDSIGHCEKKVCLILNGYRDTAV